MLLYIRQTLHHCSLTVPKHLLSLLILLHCLQAVDIPNALIQSRLSLLLFCLQTLLQVHPLKASFFIWFHSGPKSFANDMETTLTVTLFDKSFGSPFVQTHGLFVGCPVSDAFTAKPLFAILSQQLVEFSNACNFQ